MTRGYGRALPSGQDVRGYWVIIFFDLNLYVPISVCIETADETAISS